MERLTGRAALTREVALIFFDVGGVLSVEMIETKLRDLACAHGLDPGRVLALGAALRPEADRGRISDATFWRRVLEEAGARPGPLDHDVQAYLRPVEGTLELIRARLSGRRRVGILSNDSVELARARRAAHGFDAIFDPVVISGEIGLVKPEPGIYLHAAARAGVAPGGCLFVDDRPDNLEGARRAGMQALRFIDAHDLERALAARGLLG